MSIDARALNEARAWLGTPYRHQCSLQHIGCDCLGLVRGVFRALHGFEPTAPPPYTPDWAEALGQETLLQAAQSYLVPTQVIEPGRVLLFRPRVGAPVKHVAIASEGGRMIHAYWGRAVCETAIGPWWRARLAAVFQFPEHP
jgi:NlpC/P60 family putative phage cell wall peptidase